MVVVLQIYLRDFQHTLKSKKSKEGSLYFLFDDLSSFVLNVGHSRPSYLLRRRGIDLCKITQLNFRKKFPMFIYPFQHCHVPTLENCNSVIKEQQSLSLKGKQVKQLCTQTRRELSDGLLTLATV